MSEVLRYAPSATVTLRAGLADGATDQYPRARVYQADGTLLNTVDLTHDALGVYLGTFAAPATAQVLHVWTITYSDAGHTAVNTSYGQTLSYVDVRADEGEAVWDVTRTAVGGAGTMGEALKVLLGTAGQTNFRMDNVVLDANGFMTSGRIRVFETAAAAGASTPGGSGEGEIFTLSLVGTADGTFVTIPDGLVGTG